jgi:hypothetical protein
MDGTDPIKCAGIEVPMEERTSLVDRLLRAIEELEAENRQLRDEIGRLKGLPPRPKLLPSTFNEPHPDPSQKKKRRGKRSGSACNACTTSPSAGKSSLQKPKRKTNLCGTTRRRRRKNTRLGRGG